MFNIRIVLTVMSALLLGVLVYVNIYAMKQDGGRGKGASARDENGGFLRMLEQSISSSSIASSTNDASDRSSSNTAFLQDGASIERISEEPIGFDAADNVRIDKLLRKVSEADTFLNDVESKLRSFASKIGMENYVDHKLEPFAKHKGGGGGSVHTTQGEPSKEKMREQRQTKDLTGLNILLLYADDWTHHTLSSYHKTQPLNTILKTPVLDALAEDGIRFTHNCVTTSVCWISRATLFTGQYMSRHGTKEPCCWSGMKKPKEKLEKAPDNWNELSVYEILAKNGYHVGHAGKWGVYMPWPKNVPFNVEEDGWHYRKLGNKMWHITEKNEADALRFLVTRPRDKPFFLNVAFYATHAKDGDVRQYMPQNSSMSMYAHDEIPVPATATDEAWKKMPYFFTERNEGRARWHSRFENHTLHQSMMKNYYRMATEVDTACGVILEELRRQGELDNTVIIFTTGKKS